MTIKLFLNLYLLEKCVMTKSEGEKKENKRETIVRHHKGIEKGRVIHLRNGVIHKKEREVPKGLDPFLLHFLPYL